MLLKGKTVLVAMFLAFAGIAAVFSAFSYFVSSEARGDFSQDIE
jgi:hypothetical protein